MFTKLLSIAILLGGAALASGQAMLRPDVPDKINAPANDEVVLKAHASGSQIYVCQAGADSKPAWSLKAPEAELLDSQGAVIGHHSSGPTWKNKDGSEITGKVTARVNAPDSRAIQWLLVSVTGHSGKKGILSRVTNVQRIDTHGGMPPADEDCNTSKVNSEVKSPYTADYYFFAPAK